MICTLLAEAPADYGWRPFLTPLPIWNYWFWLLLPLAIGVALAYKSTKCREASQIPKEAALLATWIVLGLIGAALAIGVVVKVT